MALLEPFPHAVASGDPLHDRVIIWTRVTSPDAEVEVVWTVARDPALEHLVASGTEIADPSSDHTVKVDVQGLEPGSSYFYAFHALGSRSPVGRARTLPRGPCDHLRIAVCACARYGAGHFNAYGRIANRDDLAFVLHLGDYIYEYGNNETGPRGHVVRPVEPPHEARTLDDYRRRYAHYRLDPDVQRLHLRHSLVATVDDHEFCNDTWREGAGKHDPEVDGDWNVRKSAALRAWHEWIPVRAPDPSDPGRIYRSVELGGLADLVLLDGRTKRDQQTKDPGKMDDPDRTILGPDQYAWLIEQIDSSRATWRLIANGVMIGQCYSEFMPEEIGEPLSDLGVLTKREHGPEPDQWDGYTAERDRLLSHIQHTERGNIVFLSGDVHSSWAVELHRDHREKKDAPLAVEFVATSVTSENLDEHMRVEPRTASLRVEREVVDANPHIRWVELDSHGYFVLDLTSERVQADWFFVDGVTERSPGERWGSGWLARAGETTLRRARSPAD
jgi:alkaline phosphatase D